MDMAVITTAEATMVMVAVMGEEVGIGTTTQMVVMRIVATTVGQIALGEVGAVVVGVGGVSPLPL